MMKSNQMIPMKSNERKSHQPSYSPTPYSISNLLQRQSDLSTKPSNSNITVNRVQYHNMNIKNPLPSTVNDKKIIEGDLISSSNKNSSNILQNHFYQQQQRPSQNSIYDLIKGTKAQVKSTRPGHFNSKTTHQIHKIPRKSPLPIPKSLVDQKYLPSKIMGGGMFASMNSVGRLAKDGNKKGLSEQMSHTFYTKNTTNRSLSPIIRKKESTPKMSPNARPMYKNYSPIPGRSMMIEKFKRFQMNNPMMKSSKSKNIAKPNYMFNNNGNVNANNIMCYYPNNNNNNNKQGKPTVFTMNILQDNTMEKEQVMINHSHHNIMHGKREKEEDSKEEENDRRVGNNSNANTNPSFSGSSNNPQGFKTPSESKKDDQTTPELSNDYTEVLHEKTHSMAVPISNIKLPSSTKVIKKIKNIYEFTHVGHDGEQDKENNQDSYFIHKNFAGHKDYIYMSVCDGHGSEGHFVSGFIKKILPVNLSRNLMNTNILHDEQVHDIISETFLDANDKLVSNKNINSTYSGSTCVSLIYTPERIIVPNIGDSRAVMGRCTNGEWIGIDLSRDHKPTEKDEENRIIECKGRIEPFIDDGEYVGPHRVWLKDKDVPGLAMTRSFGDNVAASVGVISDPEIKEFDFHEDDKFMIIASDGVWEFIESTDCINMIKPFCLKNDFRGCCQYIYNESKRRWVHEEEVIDDITMIIVVFE